ncbi:MAG: hypothetical protein LRS46_03465 [Desulfurococcales archaeon]|nr:hypothetical protein [Desulfurococcales archaeon]
MFDVIITGSVVYTGSKVIRDGYVYIKGGVIRDVGEQPVPEDYTYATLVLGGPHRVLAPGLAVVADVVAYPLRFRSPSTGERIRLYEALHPRAQALLALPGVYELHMRGFTTIIVEALDPQVVFEIKSLAGGNYGIAVPACKGEVQAALPTLSVSLPGCSGEGSVTQDDILYIAGSPIQRALSSMDADTLWNKNLKLRELAGLPSGLIEPGQPAEIAIFDARKPPAAFLDYHPDRVLEAYLVGATVETLIVGDEVIVDAGQHLNIVEKHLNMAIEESEKILMK